MRCIYCKKEHSTKTKEHIIPEAIGCPSDAILNNGEVCEPCNNILGHRIDRHVVDAFDVLAFHHNVPRKKGRSPVISSRGNVKAEYIDNEAHYFFNRSNQKIFTDDGYELAGYNKNKKRHLKVDVNKNGAEGTCSFKVEIGNNDPIGFTRGIFKIALGSLTRQIGIEEALSDKYDSVRNFIMTGAPIFRCISTLDDNNVQENSLSQIWIREGHYIVPIRLYGIDFLCDLEVGQKLFVDIFEKFKTHAKDGTWTYYPVD